MKIIFSKPKGQVVLTCVRADGSTTYSKPGHGEFFALHDLMHFAVETTLGLRGSFFGLVAAGRSIPSFHEPGAAATLPVEAVHTEHLVNLLLQEQAFGAPADAAVFNRGLSAAVAGAKGGLPPALALSDDDLSRIRATYAGLLHEYRAVAAGGELTLEFPFEPARP